MTENLQKTFGDYLGRTTMNKTYDKEFQWKVGSFFLREPRLLEKIDYPVGKYINFEGIGKALRRGVENGNEDCLTILDTTTALLEDDNYDVGYEVFSCLDYDNILVFFDEFCKPEELGNDILNDARFQPVFEDNKFIGLRLAD